MFQRQKEEAEGPASVWIRVGNLHLLEPPWPPVFSGLLPCTHTHQPKRTSIRSHIEKRLPSAPRQRAVWVFNVDVKNQKCGLMKFLVDILFIVSFQVVNVKHLHVLFLKSDFFVGQLALQTSFSNGRMSWNF